LPGHEMGRRAVDTLAGEGDRPFARAIEPGDDVEQRALAGPVRPDHGLDRTSRDVERNTAQRNDAAEANRDVTDPEKRFVHCVSSPDRNRLRRSLDGCRLARPSGRDTMKPSKSRAKTRPR